MAIIATLVGLLLPAVQSSREAGRRTQCASNLRQVGLGWLGHTEAHRGRFPRTDHEKDAQGRSQSWIFTMAPWIESCDAIRICPSDSRAEERRVALATSYLLNSFVAMAIPDAVDRMSKLTASSRTLVTFEISPRMAPKAANDHAHPNDWFSDGNIAQEKRYPGWIWYASQGEANFGDCAVPAATPSFADMLSAFAGVSLSGPSPFVPVGAPTSRMAPLFPIISKSNLFSGLNIRIDFAGNSFLVIL